jgi:hypothetical protein
MLYNGLRSLRQILKNLFQIGGPNRYLQMTSLIFYDTRLVQILLFLFELHLRINNMKVLYRHILGVFIFELCIAKVTTSTHSGV